MFVELLEFQGRHMPALIGTILPERCAHLPFVQGSRRAEGPARLRPIPGQMLVRAFIGLFMSYAITACFFSRVTASEQPTQGAGDLRGHPPARV